MPHGRRVRRRPAVHGHRQGQQGPAAAGGEAGGRVLRLLRRLSPNRRKRPQLLTFVTRRGCHLCEQALPVVQRLAADAGVPVEVRDVDADPAFRERWTDHVPVVLLDGEQHSLWYVDEDVLARALKGR